MNYQVQPIIEFQWYVFMDPFSWAFATEDRCSHEHLMVNSVPMFMLRVVQIKQFEHRNSLSEFYCLVIGLG